MKAIIVLVLIVVVSGCINVTQETKGLDIRVEAAPDKLFPNGEVNVFVDVENLEEKTYRNVNIDIFDIGELEGDCQRSIAEMKPSAIESLECTLQVPDDLSKDQTVSTRVTFDGNLVGSTQVEIISQEEYDLRTKAGNLQRQPKTYTFADKNMQVTIDFDEAPPLVPGKKQFMRVNVKNSGNGLVGNIKPGAISITANFLDCPERGELSPTERDFPTVVCEVNVPEVNYLSQDLINIDIEYSYDVRKSILLPR